MTSIYFSSWNNMVVDNRDKDVHNYDPVTNISLPEYFRQDEEIKALIGWNGIVLRSQEVNVVDLCRSYMEAVRDHSCGQCFPCRIGTSLIADTLGKICKGEGSPKDIDKLLRLSEFVSGTSKCNIGRSGPLPLLDALRYFGDSFEKAIAEKQPIEADHYHSTLTAPCMDACPIHLDIPTYIGYIKEGKYAQALDTIYERLPLPGVVGRVCVRPCEEHCRRNNLDEAVSIKYLKRFVADYELSLNHWPVCKDQSSEKTGQVAIVGAGPAGVTCAFHLARKGHKVTIYEQLKEPGGMAAVGIPDYRLPRTILRDEVEQIQKMGVTIHYGTSVGKDIKLSELEQNFDAVFISIGAHSSSSMRVEGEDKGYEGFVPGVEYLREINEGRDPYPKGKRVVVIGGGNVAIDCVRSAFRIHKEDVNLVYRRTRKEMPADEVEIRDAEEENVIFHFLTTPVRIIAEDNKVVGLECIRMELGEPDASGRRRPVPVKGSEFTFDCDTVVPAIGQAVDLSVLEGTDGVETTGWHTIVVNDVTKQTSRPKIFSAGDCETGPGALITACAGGRKAAQNIDHLINGQSLEPGDDDYFDQFLKTVKVYDPDEKVGIVGGRERKHLVMLPPDTRKTSFEEVEKGFSVEDARTEASRCLRCYCIATVSV
ncbi:MAG: FAD-dependent oxidoreductase [Thermodesulfobacteriota bacterium]|nr:FAD-dependent oxidoreductase [Thermodesulfobacteriota bacterium]